MTEVSFIPSESAQTRPNRWLIGAVIVALGLIFSGVVLHLFFPNRGEPLAPGPPASYPHDGGEPDLEPIPPEFFDGAPGEEDGTPGANQL